MGDLAPVAGQRSGDDFVFQIQVGLALIVHQLGEEGDEVVGVEGAAGLGHGP